MQTKNILILGGSSGIGAGLSEFYHQNGAQVYVGARRIETIEKSNLNVKAFYFDIDQLDKLITKLEEQASKIGNIDLIINCIGIGEINKDLDAEIDLSIIQTNVALALQLFPIGVSGIFKNKGTDIMWQLVQ